MLNEGGERWREGKVGYFDKGGEVVEFKHLPECFSPKVNVYEKQRMSAWSFEVNVVFPP